MMASRDALLIDSYAATLMGFSPDEIGYIKQAEEIGMGGHREWQVVELSKPERTSAKPSGTAARLSAYTEPDEACSACYASLVHALKRLEEEGGMHAIEGRRIAIGQGYRGKAPEIGVGACCAKARISVSGCPAKADDILSMLRTL